MRKTISSLILLVLAVLFNQLIGLTNIADASNVTTTQTSILLSQSAPLTLATHTITFTPSDTSSVVSSIQVQYSTSASTVSVPSGLSISANPAVTVTTNGTNIPNSSTYSSGLVTITFNTPQTLANGPVIITIPNVTNPSGSGTIFYTQTTCLTGSSTVTDYGVAETQTNSNITINGIMDPILIFSISGVTASSGTSAITGGMNNATVNTTGSSISFGHFALNGSGNNNVAVQQISTQTNASNGYSVYLQENQPLTNGPKTIADIGANTTWQNGVTTGFGVNVTNSTNGDKGTSFVANTTFQPVPVNTNSLVLATKSSPTTGTDTEDVIFQVGINASQASGSYSNSINYVALPQF